MAQLHAWDAIMDYVEDNGPMTFSSEGAEAQKAFLEQAGFTITPEK